MNIINILRWHRNFSSSNILLVKKKNTTLSREDRMTVSAYEKEYVSKNPVPKMVEAGKIELEKAVDIAAAYKNNIEGLEKRKKDLFFRFEEVQDNYFGEYFTTKNDELLEHLNKVRIEQGKTTIDPDRGGEYMDKVRVDSDKVLNNTLSKEFENCSFLPSSLVRLLKDSLKKHDKAQEFIAKNPDYVFSKGKANNIDKELYKKAFEIEKSISDEVNEASSSKDTNRENFSLKRSVEGESSQGNKRVKISDLLNDTSKDNKGSGSGQGPYTAYSIEPNYEKSQFFLLFELLLIEDLAILFLAPVILIVLLIYGILQIYKRFTKKK